MATRGPTWLNSTNGYGMSTVMVNKMEKQYLPEKYHFSVLFIALHTLAPIPNT